MAFRTPKDVFNYLDPRLTRVFLPLVLRHPRYLGAVRRFGSSIRDAKQLREDALSNGLKVPPALILSITSQCNLNCTGCYASVAGITTLKSPKGQKQAKPQLKSEQWRAIIKEASELGVICFVIAGGEPFLFPGLLELCEEFKNRFFIIFTNGTAITEADFKRLKKSSNIAVIVSIEGGQGLTNKRRGRGVYENTANTLKRLGRIGVPNGVSVTITRLNHKYWMRPENIKKLIAQGVRLGFFIEYIPTSSTSEHLMLTKEERAKFRSQILRYRKEKPLYLIHSPGDEEYFGGCISAGRGFAHITPAGDLTPCPVSNIATHNLTKATLREGLSSLLFKEIRDSEHLLENEDTPCALFAHPDEVEELAKAVGAYRTG